MRLLRRLAPALAVFALLASACTEAAAEPGRPLSADAEAGRKVAQAAGCVACHSVNGSNGRGPTWKGLYGSEVGLANGSKVTADDAYLKESITHPNAKVVMGFPPAMPAFRNLKPEQLDQLVEYMKAVQ